MSAHVLVIDNYDSFTYNLVQALGVMGPRITVRRHDEIGVDEALASAPTHLLISPGPGHPESAGVSVPLIEAMMSRVPVLGVCLGHQAIAHALGAAIVPARCLKHGKASEVRHDGLCLFEGLPNPLSAGRYHSLAVDQKTLPYELEVTAYTRDGEIMGLRHRHLPTEGVQFHPESVLTPYGDRLLSNFLRKKGARRGDDRMTLRPVAGPR